MKRIRRCATASRALFGQVKLSNGKDEQHAAPRRVIRTNNSVSGNTEPLASSALADGIAKMGHLEALLPKAL